MGRHHAAWAVFAVQYLTISVVLSAFAVESGGQQDNPAPDDSIGADPLFQQESVSFEDLQDALQDPSRRHNVIKRHFTRAASLTENQQRRILELALTVPSDAAGRQAVQELARLGWLTDVVEERISSAGFEAELAFKTESATETASSTIPAELLTAEYIRQLIEDSASDSTERRFAADRQLDALGMAAVAELLKALTEERLRPAAASALGRILAQAQSRVPADAETGPGPDPETMPPPKTRSGVSAVTMVRELDAAAPEMVRVHFGTNREPVQKMSSAGYVRNGLAALLVAASCGWSVYRHTKPAGDAAERSRAGCGTALLALLLVIGTAWGLQQLNAGWRQHFSQHTGGHFGGHRAADGRITFGYCDVSVPLTHRVGEVERPTIGAEDEQEHVVLKRTEQQGDREFFELVRQRLASAADAECFVFVHGFNVTFDDAARRTAQIHYDLKFKGVPLFFSWPSRGGLRHYFADRNEILVSREAIRQFLSDVAERTGADRIHVIAHSMGADAVCQAIAELDSQGAVFEQVILAAPDIDAEVFEKQLLPKMAPKARRMTLYCSTNDLALHASYHFNDSRRAGDSSERLVLCEGLDTIDASNMDTELLGHSYYGSCQPLIDDVRRMMADNLPPPERDLEPRSMGEAVPAWTFRAE